LRGRPIPTPNGSRRWARACTATSPSSTSVRPRPMAGSPPMLSDSRRVSGRCSATTHGSGAARPCRGSSHGGRRGSAPRSSGTGAWRASARRVPHLGSVGQPNCRSRVDAAPRIQFTVASVRDSLSSRWTGRKHADEQRQFAERFSTCPWGVQKCALVQLHRSGHERAKSTRLSRSHVGGRRPARKRRVAARARD
jgi:hypothetical protein